jgi:hypothetical protein
MPTISVMAEPLKLKAAAHRRAAAHQHPQHYLAALARLVEARGLACY